MANLVIINEIFTNGFSYNLLNVISVLSLVSGVLVIVSKNPIVSVLFLIGLFLSIAGYLMMLGINFIGLSYLLVYVGAVSILFLFILMLINIRISELVTENNNSIPLAIMVSIIFGFAVYKLLPFNYIFFIHLYNIYMDSLGKLKELFNLINENDLTYYSRKLFFVSSQIWDGYIAESSHITSIGNVIYTVYPIWIILTSLILLLAMVGVIIISINK